LLTRVNNALQAIENNQFTIHAEQENLVQTIAGWMDEAKAQPNEFLRKSMMSSIKSIMKQMNMQFTPVQPYDDLVNRTGSRDAHGVVSKIVSRIAKFTGTDDRYKWDSFYICFAMAVQNASYSDAELKAIFLQCLDGKALIHYQANFEEYQFLDYKALIGKYSARFGPKKKAGLQDILGITQAANEDIMGFKDRLTIAAKPMLPPQVPKKRMWERNGTAVEVDNPDYDEELLKRNAALKQHYAYLVQIFLSGIRKEILERMQTTNFESLEEAAETASEAEDYLKSVKQLHYTHNLTCESLEVNAVKIPSKPLNDMERRGVPRGRSQTRSNPDEDVCFKCNRKGHWQRNCPTASKSSKSRSTSHGRKNYDNKADYSLHQKLDRLVDLLTAQQKGGKPRHRSQSGDKSRGRSQTRSGSKSRYNSNHRANNRSQSTGSKGSKPGSRSNSKSRSQSKNGRWSGQ
jgi:hypothetical protein